MTIQAPDILKPVPAPAPAPTPGVEPLPLVTPRPRPESERILRLLLLLGETADQVAARLLLRGIKGQPRDFSACPLANYLRREGVLDPCIDGLTLFASAGPFRVIIRLGSATQRFVSNFDLGLYPDLVGGR